MFQPHAGDTVHIGGSTWRFAAHPGLDSDDIPHLQEGRAGIVYLLVDDRGNARALKVFKERYRQPGLVRLAEQLEQFADVPGLTVCRRLVLTSQRDSALLRQHPELLYAALMPWIEGEPWFNVARGQGATSLSPATSLELARRLVDILVTLEQQEIAHGDLSGTNVLIDGLDTGRPRIELVDVEQLYAPGLSRPTATPGGSPGYAHHRAGAGLWQPDMDRFAGAVLLAEMLGACDERIRAAAAGDAYFAEGEEQQISSRYQTLATVLGERFGHDVTELFMRTWLSDSLAECPPFGSWALALADAAPAVAEQSVVEPHAAPAISPPEAAAAWLAQARASVQRGDLAAAIAAYRAARAADVDEGLRQEIGFILAQLEEKYVATVEIPRLTAEAAQAEQQERWAAAVELYAGLLARFPDAPEYDQWAKARERARERANPPPPPPPPPPPETSFWRRYGWLAALLLLILLLSGVYAAGVLTARDGAGASARLVTPTQPLEPATAPVVTESPAPTEQPLVVLPTEGLPTEGPPTSAPQTEEPPTFAPPTPEPPPVSPTAGPPTSTPQPPTRQPPTRQPPTPRQPTLEPTVAPRPVAIQPVAPAYGTYWDEIEYSWQGSPGLSYRVQLRNADRGFAHTGPWVNNLTWSFKLPAEQFGNWTWWVESSDGRRTQESNFVYDPYANIGGPVGIYDLNNDCRVDGADLDIIAGYNYGCSVGETCYSDRVDFNGDGYIGDDDVAQVSSHLGREVPNCTPE